MINYTVIIPHYNIPQLLMRCMRSIPVREDIQVIVVDDCSPDASRYMADYPELSRPYLEYYSTPKGGSAGRARNVGLDHAKGRWLVFADADDFFVENLEEILDAHVDDEEDIVVFASKSVYSDDIQKEADRDSRDNLFREYNETGQTIQFRAACPTPWGKLIKQSLVEEHHIRFDETKWSNDYYFSALTGVKAREIKVVQDILYVVTVREGSLSSELRNTESVPSKEELNTRLSVALKVQALLDNCSVGRQYESYNHYAHLLLKKYPFSFWKSLCTKFFSYPLLCLDIIHHRIAEKLRYVSSKNR